MGPDSPSRREVSPDPRTPQAHTVLDDEMRECYNSYRHVITCIEIDKVRTIVHGAQ